MLGKALGAIAGAKVAQHSSKLGTTGGALLGLATSVAIRRLAVPTILAIAAGGLLAKWTSERRR